MKARTSFAIVVLLLLVGRTRGGNVDKAKLRELAKLPKIDMRFGFGISSISGFGYGEKLDHLAEIERIQKQMKGDPSDAERYILLTRHYKLAEREKEAKKACAKAIALCRPQLREHPGDIGWFVRLGEALGYNGETKEAETLLRRAVKDAPNDWRAWLALADCVDRRSNQAIFGEKSSSFAFSDDYLMLPAVLARKSTTDQVAPMRRLQQEAHGYYDRSVNLAPHDQAKPYLSRWLSSSNHELIEASLRTIQGEKINPITAYLAPECLADMRQIARLSRDDPQVVGMAMFCEFLACITNNKLELKAEISSLADYRAARNRSMVDVLPLESRTFVLWGLERLERLTKHADKAKAAAASEILADGLMVMDGMGEDCGAIFLNPTQKAQTIASALEHLRRAVQLDPSRERAWDWLTMLLSRENNNAAEAISTARKRIEINDNVANRFLLARVYADDKQFAKVAEQLQAGLKIDPQDLNCRLGLIALALKQEDARTLKEAGAQLDVLQARIKATKSKYLWTAYHQLRGIHNALTDRPDWAMAEFQTILQWKKGDAAATRAFVALGEPLGPAEQQLAIDYIKEQHGLVAGTDSHTPSPVERIALNRDTITDVDLFVLTAFPQLHELNLSCTAITDGGIAHLKCLRNLKKLHLDGTKITDAALSDIEPLGQVEYLSLSSTNITDAGLVHLQRLKQLRLVNVQCTRVTPHGIAQLRMVLPKLEIYR